MTTSPLSFDLHSFAETPELPIEWLWTDVIPRGMLTILGGKQGLGKSYAICDLAARLSAGMPMPDGTASPPGNVLLLVREDDPGRVLLPRLRAAGADLNRVKWSTMTHPTTHGTLDLVEKIAELTEAVIREKFELVVIDTFAAFAPDGSDSNNGQDVRKVLDAAAKLARLSNAAVIVVAHLKKNNQADADPMDAIAGSVQMTAGVRAAILLDKGRLEGERWWRVVKMNVGDFDKAGWTWRFLRPDPATPKSPPPIQWAKAGEEYKSLHEDRRAKRTTVKPDEVHAALAMLLAKKPLAMTEATERVHAELKKTMPSVAKADVKSVVGDLFAEPPNGMEVGKGERSGQVLALKGCLPMSAEERARRIAKLTPDISAAELSKRAECRREVACRILRELRSSEGAVPMQIQSGNLGTPARPVESSDERSPYKGARVGTGTEDGNSTSVPRGAA